MIDLNNTPKPGFGLMRLPRKDEQIDRICKTLQCSASNLLKYVENE